MNNNETIEQYIQNMCPQIANILCEIIPEQWLKIYLYAEIHKNSGTVIFYYNNKDKYPIYSLDISKKYNVNNIYI